MNPTDWPTYFIGGFCTGGLLWLTWLFCTAPFRMDDDEERRDP